MNSNIVKDLGRFLIKKVAQSKFRIIDHRSAFSPKELWEMFL